ncbi:hypothetical protein RAA17_15550 [Komagataeibacter rhaeticus]|nr:hypothetical protein [Komagataeibacter rhaeticus]
MAHLGGAMVWPAMADIHTHLDKGFIWDRTPNPDGTFMGALQAVNQDREAYWSVEDVRRRMTFALRCAHAHGTQAVRTHLDTMGAHGHAVWPLIREMQAQWAGRIALQAVSLAMPQSYAGRRGAHCAGGCGHTGRVSWRGAHARQRNTRTPGAPVCPCGKIRLRAGPAC